MELIKFPGHNVVYAEHQPEYNPLPCYRESEFGKNPEGRMTCCWQLTWRERLQLLWSGKLWHTVLTFWQPLQPQLLETTRPGHIPSERQDPRDASKAS
jgi:hypothetical protein